MVATLHFQVNDYGIKSGRMKLLITNSLLGFLGKCCMQNSGKESCNCSRHKIMDKCLIFVKRK